MLTTDRDQALDQVLGIAIADFDIPNEVYSRAVDRYEDVGAWLSDVWAESPINGLVYPQGSFRLGTVVQPINPRDEYDIDLVCRRDLTKDSTTQAELKQDVGGGLADYVASGPDGLPTRSEGKRCWTLDYPGEPFHMDVLPAIPNLDGGGNAIWLTDKELRLWQPSNPIDYASWFQAQMTLEFAEVRKSLERRMEVADVPWWSIRTTLQRTVQALKRHRDMFFAKRPQDRPASIIITTLAARAYSSGGTLYEVLVKIASTMPGLVEIRGDTYWVANPVQRDENFADRWQRHPGADRNFFEWMEQANADFNGYGVDRGLDRILEKVAKSFGDLPAKRAGLMAGHGMKQVSDAGILGIGGTGLLRTGVHRPAPAHEFHGDAPEDTRA